MQINDRFGAAAAFETVSLPDGTEAAVPTEHAAALYVNEQPAFRVVCTPELLPQLALGAAADGRGGSLPPGKWSRSPSVPRG